MHRITVSIFIQPLSVVSDLEIGGIHTACRGRLAGNAAAVVVYRIVRAFGQPHFDRGRGFDPMDIARQILRITVAARNRYAFFDNQAGGATIAAHLPG